MSCLSSASILMHVSQRSEPSPLCGPPDDLQELRKPDFGSSMNAEEDEVAGAPPEGSEPEAELWPVDDRVITKSQQGKQASGGLEIVGP